MTKLNQMINSDALHWRCIGPPRGGRVVAVSGDYHDAMTFYFGACAGGIWKTTDGGTYWECVSDDREEQVESVFFDWLVGKSNSKIRSGSVKLLLLETSDK